MKTKNITLLMTILCLFGRKISFCLVRRLLCLHLWGNNGVMHNVGPVYSIDGWHPDMQVSIIAGKIRVVCLNLTNHQH